MANTHKYTVDSCVWWCTILSICALHPLLPSRGDRRGALCDKTHRFSRTIVPCFPLIWTGMNHGAQGSSRFSEPTHVYSGASMNHLMNVTRDCMHEVCLMIWCTHAMCTTDQKEAHFSMWFVRTHAYILKIEGRKMIRTVFIAVHVRIMLLVLIASFPAHGVPHAESYNKVKRKRIFKNQKKWKWWAHTRRWIMKELRAQLTVSARPGTVLLMMDASFDRMLTKAMMAKGTPHERNCSSWCMHMQVTVSLDSRFQWGNECKSQPSCTTGVNSCISGTWAQQKFGETYDVAHGWRHQGLWDGRAVGVVLDRCLMRLLKSINHGLWKRTGSEPQALLIPRRLAFSCARAAN